MSSRDWVSVSMPYLVPGTPGAPDAWSAEAADHGGVGTQRLLHAGEIPAADEVADALQVAPGSTVVVRRRLILLDDRPVELTTSYYPASIAQGTALAEPRKIRGGAVGLLAELGWRPRRAREDVRARRPTEEERLALILPDSAWVLAVSRLLTNEAGVPVEFSEMVMVADGRRLRYQLTID